MLNGSKLEAIFIFLSGFAFTLQKHSCLTVISIIPDSKLAALMFT